jgi:DedD protein
MATATSEDTEITLGTGKMLLLFFGLVALCAVFFAMGFSLGRNSVLKTPFADVATAPSSPADVRTPAAKTTPTVAATTPAAAPEKPEVNPSANASASTPEAINASATAPATASATPAIATNGYSVQVAAVSKQEDADALVDALKRKQYPAFSASAASDKLFHVQVGPYAEIKDAEAMRAKLVSDGYNPILKK